MTTKQCDETIYTHGTSVGLFNMTKKQAEQYCQQQTTKTGITHDWHYTAGRVNIKKAQTHIKQS